MSVPTNPVLEDAKLVGQYASETGVSVPTLRDAIARAQAEQNSGGITQDTEQQLLAAQGDAIKVLQATNLRAIQGWYSPTNKYLGWFNRFAAFAVMIWCLLNIVPLTFLYSDTTTRVNNIGLFCNNGEKISSAQKLDQYLTKCLAWNFPKKEGATQSAERIRHSMSDSPKPGEAGRIINAVASDGSPSAAVSEGGGSAKTSSAPPSDAEKAAFYTSSPFMTVRVFLTPPTAMLLMDLICQGAGAMFPGYEGKLTLFTNPLREGELIRVIESNPGSALYNAARDYGFMVYVLGSGYLPMLYGMLGASVFLLRRSLSSDPADYLMVTSGVQTFMRIGLGGVAGIIIGWFNIPNADNITTLASTQFAIAFLAGFSIDIVFALLDRMVSVFDFKR